MIEEKISPEDMRALNEYIQTMLTMISLLIIAGTPTPLSWMKNLATGELKTTPTAVLVPEVVKEVIDVYISKLISREAFPGRSHGEIFNIMVSIFMIMGLLAFTNESSETILERARIIVGKTEEILTTKFPGTDTVN